MNSGLWIQIRGQIFHFLTIPYPDSDSVKRGIVTPLEVWWIKPWNGIRSQILNLFAIPDPDSDPEKRGIITPLYEIQEVIGVSSTSLVNELCDLKVVFFLKVGSLTHSWKILHIAVRILGIFNSNSVAIWLEIDSVNPNIVFFSKCTRGPEHTLTTAIIFSGGHRRLPAEHHLPGPDPEGRLLPLPPHLGMAHHGLYHRDGRRRVEVGQLALLNFFTFYLFSTLYCFCSTIYFRLSSH